MKTIAITAIILAMGGTASQAHALDLAGSDTLEDLAILLIGTGSCGAGLVYVDGGSGTGQTAVFNGTQQVTPMSRAFNASNATCNATGEGMFMAMDALSIVADSEQTERCGGGHARRAGSVFSPDGTVNVVNSGPTVPPTSSFSDLGANWATKIRTLFSGSDGSGSAAACNAADRVALANNYKGLFADNCATGAGQANQCGAIKHLYRRGDASGTTDIFKALVGQAAGGGAITGFCNGNDQQDNDPIRRDCTRDEQVCNADNKLGLLLPILAPELGAQADVYNNAKCQSGKFLFRAAPLLDPTCCLRAPVTNACLRGSTFTQCQTPVTSGNLPCLNGNQVAGPSGDSFPNLPVGWPKVAGQNMNPGVFNLYTRDNNATARIKLFRSGTVEASRSFYRIHSTAGGRDHSVIASSPDICRIPNATEQIGCLVQKPNSSCSIGFAGYAAVDGPGQAFAEPFSLNNIDIGQQSVQNVALAAAGQPTVGPTYPLSRKLYLNTTKGFEAVTGPELDFAKCFANVTNAQLSLAGFFPVPALPGNQGATPVCESMCPQSNTVNGGHCAGNPAPFN